MRLTLRARILAVYLVALVAFLGALGYGLLQVRSSQELTRVEDIWVPLSQLLTDVRYRYPEVELSLIDREKKPLARRQYAESQVIQIQAVHNTRIRELQEFATRRLKTAAGASDRVTNVVTRLGMLTKQNEDIGPALNKYLDALDAVEKSESQGDEARKRSEDARSAARAELIAVQSRTQEILKDAAVLIDAGIRADVIAARIKAQRSLAALGALTVVATLFGLIAIAIVGRALSPVGELIAGAKRISAGDFGRRIEVGTEGTEIAALATEFNRMAESLASRDERLRLLAAFNENVLESVRVGIVVADATGAITGVNRAAEEIWRMPRGELLGKALSVLGAATGKEGATVVERVESVRAGGAAVRLSAVELPSGRMVEVSASPFLESGKATGVVVVAEDVTDRVAVERALLRSERLAAIGRMSSQITHEVRNPLNSLSLNVEMLEEELGEKEGEARELLRAIANEIERLTQITEGYLGFARLPKPQLEREQVNPLVDSLLRFVKEEAEKAGVRVAPDLGEGLPEVLADENQLRQAMLNVVRNSLEALAAGSNGNGSSKRGGTLAVSTRKTGGQVEVVFRDDGPGIAPKDLARIFDPFYSTKSEGTGLGLPLTQQIIEEHGGTIACASEPGRGTVFTIRLPAAGGPA